MCLHILQANEAALCGLQIINESLAVSNMQRAEWQAQQAQARAKLQTRKRGEATLNRSI